MTDLTYHQVDENKRSKLTLTDDSRVGTYLDGEKFLKENRVLTKNEHEIKLASYEQIFRYVQSLP